MTSTSTSERFPWPSLLVLGGAAFVMVTAEMLPTVVLRPMSDGLSTTDAGVAQLVSMWAALVVLASFPLVALTRRFERREVIVVSLVGLAASALLTAAAPSYPAAVGARLLGAAAVGLLWASVNAHVADIVPDEQLGSAVSVVLGGATLGMVLGTPAARLVADLTNWRASFVVLGALGALAAVLVRLAVPSAARRHPTDAGPATPGGRRPLAPLLTVTGLVALVLVGHYGVYTYVTVLVEAPARALPGGMGAMLLIFGVASAIGITLAGRVRHRTLTALVVAVLATALTVAAMGVVDARPMLGIGIVIAWGVASGAVPALAQTEIMRRAGEHRRALAGALIPVLFNGGIAVGATLASMLADARGAQALPLPSAAVIVVAGLALTAPLLRPSRVVEDRL